jgi:threonylcarbamoyladenosine tRNA methylthiotransferase MtaB
MPSFSSMHFGCRANQADTAAIERDLARLGFRSIDERAAADVVVLNSCTVTATADAELRQTIRRIHRENPSARILVTGCYAQRRPADLASLPGVEWVVGNSHKSEISQLLGEWLSNPGNSFIPVESLIPRKALPVDSDLRSLGSVAHQEEPLRSRFEPSILVGDMSRQREFVPAAHFGGTIEDRARPNLKIQDGCDNRCSFCIIPSVRGLSRSLPLQTVLDEIRSLAEAGYREVVISGVNLGQYGRDLPGKPPFARLIEAILDETRVERLRLSSVEPMDFTDALLDLMASTPRIARHVHAPLQSGSDSVLRRMHRKYRAAQYRERIQAAYERMPEAAFGADVIVGFPGESERDFEATRRLIEELPLTYLHVFPFSRRPETPAEGMKDQVNGATARERGRILRQLAEEKHRGFCKRHIGRTLRVLTLGSSGSGETLALSDNYLKVFLSGHPVAGSEWREARIEALTESGLAGRDVTPEQNVSRAVNLKLS